MGRTLEDPGNLIPYNLSPLSPRMDPLILTLCWVSEIRSFYPGALWCSEELASLLKNLKEGSVVADCFNPQIKALGK